MFNVDPKTKRLITFSKSAAAWHQTQEYTVVRNQGLKLVYEITEDAFGGEKVSIILVIFFNILKRIVNIGLSQFIFFFIT